MPSQGALEGGEAMEGAGSLTLCWVQRLAPMGTMTLVSSASQYILEATGTPGLYLRASGTVQMCWDF